ncbi:MAG: hypothetical protein PWR18_762 [Synergistales bacterium]|nr:hypothetical protein [Synergistales bacterium]
MHEKQRTRHEKPSLIEAVDRAIEEMTEASEEVDFISVARRTGVARSTLYRNTIVREHIAAAREKQRLSLNTQWKLTSEVESLKQRVEELEREVESLKKHSGDLSSQKG